MRGEALAFYMDKIVRLFPRGSKISLVIRDPKETSVDGKDGAAFFSDDPGGYDAVIGVLQQLKNDKSKVELAVTDETPKEIH